jgi:hypothetical protein
MPGFIRLMSSWNPRRVLDPLPKSRIMLTCTKPLVTTVLKSGLGNRLFQIFAGLGYAERTGKQFVLCEKYILENSHSNMKKTREIIMAFFPNIKFWHGEAPIWHKHYEDVDGFYNSNLIPDISGSVMLHGYFQNYTHFPENSRLSFIVPKPTIYRSNLVDFTDTYFIHFRFGDYVGGQYDIDLDSYYRTAISNIQLNGLDCKFLVFSDQPNKINLEKYGLINNVNIIRFIDEWETLYLMSRCKGGICANSTFSWFGAFASKSHEIYMPKLWIKNKVGNPLPSWALEI